MITEMGDKKEIYNKDFFRHVRKASEDSAVPVLKTLKRHYNGEIHSAADLGCGTGAWLCGVRKVFGEDVRICGYDGDYVDKDLMLLSENEFIPWDLNRHIKKNQRYDLAISLEVAEHLPEESADVLVDSLVDIADFVLFSAAIPGQGGTEHLNEQPLSYWIGKFEKKGYEFFDIIRPDIWDHPSVSVWYKQNAAVFVRKGSEQAGQICAGANRVVDMVHPELLRRKVRFSADFSRRMNNYTERILLLQDFFSALPSQGVVVRMGGAHTERLLEHLSRENRKKIKCIIDKSAECQCKKFGYPIITPDKMDKTSISAIVLSSFDNIELLREEAKAYAKEIQVLDIYRLLELNGIHCEMDMFSFI